MKIFLEALTTPHNSSNNSSGMSLAHSGNFIFFTFTSNTLLSYLLYLASSFYSHLLTATTVSLLLLILLFRDRKEVRDSTEWKLGYYTISKIPLSIWSYHDNSNNNNNSSSSSRRSSSSSISKLKIIVIRSN